LPRSALLPPEAALLRGHRTQGDEVQARVRWQARLLPRGRRRAEEGPRRRADDRAVALQNQERSRCRIRPAGLHEPHWRGRIPARRVPAEGPREQATEHRTDRTRARRYRDQDSMSTLTTQHKSDIDKLWTEFWTGGITNPLTVIVQISFLMFARLLDVMETTGERKASRTKK